MKALVINTLLPIFIHFDNKNFKTFFTLLGFKEKIGKIGFIFGNKFFSYFLSTIGNVLFNFININNTNSNIINLNTFVYIAINQYLFNKFDGIIINIGTFKYFITNLKQFRFYTKDIKNYLLLFLNQVQSILVWH